MFAAGAMPIDRSAGWRGNGQQLTTRSAYTSPASSRRSSLSSIHSARTEPDLVSDRSASSSSSATPADSPPKTGLRFLFGRKDKKQKQKVDLDKVIITSRHAAAVQTKMMMDAHNRKQKTTKTAGITSSVHTGHMTAAQQEARHPHSGPPALHAKTDMPLLTRIASGDERDDEAELEQLTRAHLDSELALSPPPLEISSHTTDCLAGEFCTGLSSPSADPRLSPSIQKTSFKFESRSPVLMPRTACGTRFHRDQDGCWKR